MYSEKTKALIVASCFAAIMLSVRVIQTGLFHFIFLAWNLFLAWVPYILSGWLKQIPPQYKWANRFVFAAWLLFLPNAPYLVTDFIHLQPRLPVPVMFDVCMLFLFSLTGLALGLLSVQQVEQWRMQHKPGKSLTGMRSIVFLLCGFGIYLGRVERFNSWDAVTDPVGLLTDVLQKIIYPFAHMETWGITLLFAGFLWITYTLFTVMPVRKNKQTNAV